MWEVLEVMEVVVVVVVVEVVLTKRDVSTDCARGMPGRKDCNDEEDEGVALVVNESMSSTTLPPLSETGAKEASADDEVGGC